MCYSKEDIDAEAEREGMAIRGAFRGKRTARNSKGGPSIREVSTDHRTPGVDFLELHNVINGVRTND